MTLVPPSSKYGNATIVLGAGNAGWSLANPGDTNEHLLTSVAIPANTIGLGSIEIVTLWSMTNSGNNKTPIIRLGAANDLTGTQLWGGTTVNVARMQGYTIIRNRATNSQLAWVVASTTPFGPGSATAAATAAIDTTGATWLVFAAQLSTGTETLTLETYRVTLIPAV